MTRPHPSSRLRWIAPLIALLCAVGACAPSNDGDTPEASSQSNVKSAPRTPTTYVALGDSFTSAPLVPVTDVANGCLRSTGNYPTLAARKLGAELVDHSCGGARLVDLTRSQLPDVPAQLAAVKPGVDLVTIGIGGNDERVFGQLIHKCPELRSSDPEGAPCEAFMGSSGRDVLLAALENTSRRLATALDEIHRRAPDAQVLVVGYPQIVSPGHRCAALPLAKGDYAYAEKVNLALNQALRRAAQDSGSGYVDVEKASQGHDICSSEPWVNGSVNDQRRAAAYHPFAVEQKAVADLVVAAVTD